MSTPSIKLEALMESKVREFLAKDEKVAKSKGAQSYWKGFHESLDFIKDKDFRNTVFLHTVRSIQFSTKHQALTEATTSSAVATYNKAMLPTIITRVFPKLVATKFIATRQLDVPTQVIQTFRLSRKTAKDGLAAGTEFMDPAGNVRYNTPGTNSWQGNKAALDPYYSSSAVVGEVATDGAPYSLLQGPVVAGTIVLNLVSDTDPRDITLVGVDDGAGSIKSGATTITTITSYGVLNTSPAIVDMTVTVPLPAPSAGHHYELNYTYSQERNKSLSELSFIQSLIQITTRERKNFAQISAEALQDLEAYSEGKLDGLKELVAGMSESMALEIDQELILAMMSNAGKLAVFDNQYPTGQFRGTQFERNQELVQTMNYLANDMSVDFLRGDDMFAICHPHVFTILQNTNEFRMQEVDHSHQGDFSTGAERMGLLNNFKVAKAPQFPQSDKILMGYTSKDLQKTPYAYFPFVTYLTPPMPDVLSGDIFSTVVGLQQRYDHQPMLDGSHGLGLLTVQNLLPS